MTIDRWWTAALVYPAPLYAGAVVLDHFGTGGIAFPLGFGLALGYGLVTGLGLLRSRLSVWAGRLLFLLATVLPGFLGSWTSGMSVDLASGILLGAPFLWLEYAWRDTVSPGARVLALQSALLVGLLGLATLGVSPPPTGGSSGGQFLDALGQVLTGQARGVAAVLAGGTPSSMPLEATLDLAYVVLGALALASVVVSWLAPRTALHEPLPWSWGRSHPSPPESLSDPGELGLRPGQRAALASRTPANPPEAMLAPAFGPLGVAALSVAAFVVLAAVAPAIALLVLVLGIAAALIAVGIVLSRRLTPVGRLAA